MEQNNNTVLEGPGGQTLATLEFADERQASEKNFVQKDGVELLQKDSWRWASEQLTPWGNVEEHDYDFRSWLEDAHEGLLLAGCLYEYARESQKFRSWLVLRHTPKPKRFWRLVMIEFERSADDHIHLARSGWETWLDNFVAELVANESFAEVFERDPSKVAKSLAALPSYDRYPKAVQLPGGYITDSGMQEIGIQIDWRHKTNVEIGEEMKRFAALNRPQSEPEPRRAGRKRQSKVVADIKALSALRIWKLQKSEPWKRVELIAKICRYKGCKREWSEHKQRRKRGHADEPISAQAKTEMSDARTRALNLFRRLFPWGNPSNY